MLHLISRVCLRLANRPGAIIHHDHMEQVSVHVLLNQAAVCIRIFGRAPICGTQTQRHLIQCLVSYIYTIKDLSVVIGVGVGVYH
jgi:hypothetical protein